MPELLPFLELDLVFDETLDLDAFTDELRDECLEEVFGALRAPFGDDAGACFLCFEDEVAFVSSEADASMLYFFKKQDISQQVGRAGSTTTPCDARVHGHLSCPPALLQPVSLLLPFHYNATI